MPANIDHSLRDWAHGQAGLAMRPRSSPAQFVPLVVTARAALAALADTAA